MVEHLMLTAVVFGILALVGFVILIFWAVLNGMQHRVLGKRLDEPRKPFQPSPRPATSDNTRRIITDAEEKIKNWEPYN